LHLQVSRTSRSFAVSLSSSASPPFRPEARRERSSRHGLSSARLSTQPSLSPWVRSAFTTTRDLKAQQAANGAAKKAPFVSPAAPAKPKSTPQPSTSSGNSSTAHDVQDLANGLSDEPLILDEGSRQVDWARSFHGLSTEPFPKEVADTLLQPIALDDIEVKPDGVLYLPEIKYRRILNKAFGPGGWGLAPRGETIVTPKSVTREYALVAHGRLVSVARGEQDYFSPEGIPTATEGCKSNALMRCCKDLGVASELWDPRYIRKFMTQQAKEVFVEHAVNKKRRKIWLRKDDQVRYPFKETKFGA